MRSSSLELAGHTFWSDLEKWPTLATGQFFVFFSFLAAGWSGLPFGPGAFCTKTCGPEMWFCDAILHSGLGRDFLCARCGDRACRACKR